MSEHVHLILIHHLSFSFVQCLLKICALQCLRTECSPVSALASSDQTQSCHLLGFLMTMRIIKGKSMMRRRQGVSQQERLEYFEV